MTSHSNVESASGPEQIVCGHTPRLRTLVPPPKPITLILSVSISPNDDGSSSLSFSSCDLLIAFPVAPVSKIPQPRETVYIERVTPELGESVGKVVDEGSTHVSQTNEVSSSIGKW